MPLLKTMKRGRALSPGASQPRKKTKGISGLAFKPPMPAMEGKLMADTIIKRCTEVTSKQTYLDERCDACDGLSVRELVGLPYLRPGGDQVRYTMADLRYDIKGGRLAVVTGKEAVAAAKAAAARPRTVVKVGRGKKMDLDRFYAFAQCSLRMEAAHFMGKDFGLKDPSAVKLWPSFEKLAKRNLGKNEKWVPWHTVLGVHEKFLVDEVHHGKVPWWTPYHRFVAMFLFRCHCKCDLFTEVQMPHFRQQSFWKNLVAGFDAGSQMEKDMLKFRASGKALQTSCFLIIPERILADDDKNLVRNICLRSQRLVALANELWPVVNNKKMSSTAKYDKIKESILGVKMLGDTWVKMLMVCIDIARPDLQLMQTRCEVGIGAADPMRKLLENEGILEPQEFKANLPGYPALELGGGVQIRSVIKGGIASVTRDGAQIIQVTSGMAGSFDRAHAIAAELGKIAVKKGYKPGNDQAPLIKVRQQLFDNKKLKVPKLDLDKMMVECQAQAADEPKREKTDAGMTPSDGLTVLVGRINKLKSPSAKEFWSLLSKVEDHGRKHYKKLPVVVAQMKTKPSHISAVTLQVQLCEFRQFGNYQTRSA